MELRELARFHATDHHPGAHVIVTRFDRVWEPLLFVLAVAFVWFGTL
jgi:hypothetical protein